MFGDVLSQPPPRNWVVTLTCHVEDFQVLDDFVKEVCFDLEAHQPEVQELPSDDDQLKVEIRMVWNSIALEHMLRQMVPSEINIKQTREE